MSWMPAASRTGRTAPPAITPVPGTAGFKNTRPAPKCPVISHGIVVSRRGTKIRSFLACSTAFRMDSGTSLALPRPTPTWPRPSPTTTSAVNENRRPPLTTLATRLMETTRSFSSSTLGSIFASATRILPLEKGAPPPSRLPREPAGRGAAPLSTPRNPRSLKHQAAGASRVGERLHSSVVHIPATIEHHSVDPLRFRLARQELAHELGGGDVAAGRLARAELLAPAVYR